MTLLDMTDLINRPPYLYYLTNVSTQYLALQSRARSSIRFCWRVVHSSVIEFCTSDEGSRQPIRIRVVQLAPTRSTAAAGSVRVPAMLRGTDKTAALRFGALSRSGRRSQGAYSTRGVGVTPDTETNPRDNHTSPTSEHISTAETHAAGPVPGQTQGPSSLNSPPPDIEAFRSRLRDWSVLASSSLRRRADQFSKNATTTFSHLGLHLNRVTGYGEIEALKRQVVEQGIVLRLWTISDRNQRISRPRGSNQGYATSIQGGQDSP